MKQLPFNNSKESSLFTYSNINQSPSTNIQTPHENDKMVDDNMIIIYNINYYECVLCKYNKSSKY